MRTTSSIFVSLCLFSWSPVWGQPSTPPSPPSASTSGIPTHIRGLMDSEGGELLRKACNAEPRDQMSAGCRNFLKTCDTPGAASLAACKYGAASFVDASPQPVTNPNALPPKITEAFEQCGKDPGCSTLAIVQNKYPEAFAELKAWCLDRYYTPNPTGLSEPVRRRVEDVCKATGEASQGNLKPAENISYVTLNAIIKETNRVEYDYSNFGLTIPFMRIRHLGNGDIDVSGPVAAGIGAGYYWHLIGDERFTFGLDAFAYSEGIDLTKGTAQVGLAAGIGINAFKVMRFGIGIGYDLLRMSTDGSGTKQVNGLLTGMNLGAPSLSYLVTFSIVIPNGEKKDQPASEGGKAGGK